MKKRFRAFLEKYFFPWDTCCNICKNEAPLKDGLCQKCASSLKKISGLRCEKCLDLINTVGLCAECLERLPDYEKLYCTFTYSDPLKKLLYSFKFGGARYLSHVLAPLIEVEDISYDLIVPVPLSKQGLKKRGYNQALLLAEELSQRLSVPVASDILLKNDSKKSMARLDKKERRKNIKGLFYFNKKLSGETILLVDDICTTGETLRACSRELKRAGAGRIYCACVARTDLRK